MILLLSLSPTLHVAYAPFIGSVVFLGGYWSSSILLHLLRYLLRFGAVSCCDSGSYSSVVMALATTLALSFFF
jgi:hypothetical protein